ncbi:hypothetical protein JMUB7529_28450 [Staphylococcus aureus]
MSRGLGDVYKRQVFLSIPLVHGRVSPDVNTPHSLSLIHI